MLIEEEDAAVLLSNIMKDVYDKINFVRQVTGEPINFSPVDNLVSLVCVLFQRVDRLEALIQEKETENETKV